MRRIIVVALIIPACVLLGLYFLLNNFQLVSAGLIPDQTGESDLIVEHSPTATEAILEITVNYGDDWVAGQTNNYSTVVVSLTNSANVWKGGAVVTADVAGNFFVPCDDWSYGQCPDIVPGDKVLVWAEWLLNEVNPVGSISATADENTNTISGQLDAPWFAGPLEVTCEIWEDLGPLIIVPAVDPDGGSFECDFTGIWDVQKGQNIAVRYYEPDVDSVINMATWPSGRVNYAHNWVGANYAAGHTFWITVTDSSGAFKAKARAVSQAGGGWGGDGFETQDWQWMPAPPDIVPSDLVYFNADGGYTKVMEVGTINATIDTAADTVSGQIFASFIDPLIVECHPWGAWKAGMGWIPTKTTWAQPDGSIPFTCDWGSGGEWDILPGQDVAVMYQEPDLDLVIDVLREPAAYLQISKWSAGEPGAGGNFLYHIEFQNQGDAPANNVVITDTMDGGISYFSDTSGLPAGGSGSGPIVWDLGTLDPGQGGSFDLFVEVIATEGDIITNTAEIGTSSYDQGELWEKTSTWVNAVAPNDTHLNVGLDAWTGDPAPGVDYIYAINVCNNGSTGSSEVTLEVNLQDITPLQSWFAQQPGWYEVYSDPGQLTLALPSLSSDNCSEVYVRVHLDAGVEPGASLFAMAAISAANDLESEDNEATWEGNADEPHTNIWINKTFNNGSLVPGGQIQYNVEYGNNGNLPVGPLTITDTMPGGTTFLSAWHNDPFGGYEFEPDYVDGDIIVWHIAEIENGFNHSFNVTLAIDPGATPGTTLNNTAEISLLPGEDNHEDNFTGWVEPLFDVGPNLRVSKYHHWNGAGQLGYNVKIENIGSETIADLWLTDILPAGTTWDGGWDADWDWSRFVAFNHAGGVMEWQYSDFYPGDAAWLWFNADLENPGMPGQWYTNTVSVTIPIGDPSPADNLFEDVAFSGGELRRVEFWLNDNGQSHMWGEALPGTTVTVTTPAGQYFAWADPSCGGCWNIEDTGTIWPGDIVEVIAGTGLVPVVATIPNPLAAAVDTAADEVSGQIGGWYDRPLEVHGDWDAGYQEIDTDLSGSFLASYPDIPPGSGGYIRFIDEINYTEVIYHKPFYASDLVLNVNYSHDWIEGTYQAGHTVWITVTEKDGATVKGVAELHSQTIPDWDRPGFSTIWEGWQGVQPDIQPWDWVFGRVDNGFTTAVQIFPINGTIDVAGDEISGYLFAPWYYDLVDFLEVECHPWGAWSTSWPDAPVLSSTAAVDGSLPYSCAWDPAGEWDVGYDQEISVWARDLQGNRIISVFSAAVHDQEIILEAGWNMISINIDPADCGLGLILKPLEGQFILLKNGQGQVYWPGMVDDIGCWNPEHGYQIYMLLPAVLAIDGAAINPQATPILLDPGWSLVSYLRANPLPVDQALGTIAGELILAKNGAGEIYWPAFNVNQIGEMVAGEGYQVYLSGAGTLLYPAND